MRMRNLSWCLTIAGLGGVLAGLGMAQRPGAGGLWASDDPAWSDVRAILAARCVECHGGEQLKGGFRLATAETFAAGGDRGPVVDAGDPAASRLLEAISYRNPELAMPPTGQLPQEEIDLLTAWVHAGAPWPSEDYAGRPVARVRG